MNDEIPKSEILKRHKPRKLATIQRAQEKKSYRFYVKLTLTREVPLGYRHRLAKTSLPAYSGRELTLLHLVRDLNSVIFGTAKLHDGIVQGTWEKQITLEPYVLETTMLISFPTDEQFRSFRERLNPGIQIVEISWEEVVALKPEYSSKPSDNDNYSV